MSESRAGGQPETLLSPPRLLPAELRLPHTQHLLFVREDAAG